MEEVSGYLTIILPFMGVILGVWAFCIRFQANFRSFRDGDVKPAILSLLTLLCLIIGVERAADASKIGQRLSGIETALSQFHPVRHENTAKEIYHEAGKLTRTMDMAVRALIISTGPKAPEDFAETLASKMGERKRAGHEVSFTVVLALDSKKILNLDEFEKKMEERVAVYRKHDVEDALHLYIIDTPHALNFDLFIVDRKHAQIGYTSLKNGTSLNNSITLENQPHIASSLADWFDGTIVPSAQTYNSWRMREREARR